MVQLLQDWIAAQAQARPDATAVVCGTATLSYGELDAQSNRLARMLKEAGCRQGEPIALLMPKSHMAIVGLLAIYKADAVYVPLDPASPSARLRTMIKTCGITWMLAGGVVEPVVRELQEDGGTGLKVGWLEREAPPSLQIAFRLDDLAGYAPDPVQPHNRSFHPAHVLFTSAPTGVPKGVIITHANVIHCVEWATRFFGLTVADRVSCHPPLHVDMSILDIFTAAAVGAELHLVPPIVSVLPNNLAEFIRTSAITHWSSVPSVLSYMAQFDLVKASSFPALKRVQWFGDVLPTTTLMHWMKQLPQVTFTSLYGPTETTIVSGFHRVTACPSDRNDTVPLGRPCVGKEFLVLGPSLQPVPRGEVGELFIGGAGMSRGYWGDLAQTNASFMRHPQRVHERLYRTGDLVRADANGVIHLVGRRDGQIKTRGYRVELGDIESALGTINFVKDAAIVALDRGGFDGALICCAYVGADGCNPVMLRRQLSRLVPGYMLPVQWMACDALPTSDDGQVDRARVKAMFQERLSAQERRPVA